MRETRARMHSLQGSSKFTATLVRDQSICDYISACELQLIRKMTSKPLLGYWDIRGLGEPIRYLLTYLGVDYEDKRYGYAEGERDAWFVNDKFSIGLDFPNLPYYIDGDVKLTQSLAILRYIGRKYSLNGSTNEEKNAISLLEQQVSDLDNALVKVCYSPSCNKLKPDYLTTLPDQLKPLSIYLGEKPFVGGPNISYADFWLYEYTKKMSIFVPGCLDVYPNLGKFLARIESLPRLSDYIKKQKPKLFHDVGSIWNGQL